WHPRVLDRECPGPPARSLRRAGSPAWAEGALPSSQNPDRNRFRVSLPGRAGSWQDRRGGPAPTGNAIGTRQLGNLDQGGGGAIANSCASAHERMTGDSPTGVRKGMRRPLPEVASIRDIYAFEQHVATCRRHRGLDMVPEWYRVPVFQPGRPVEARIAVLRAGSARPT